LVFFCFFAKHAVFNYKD